MEQTTRISASDLKTLRFFLRRQEEAQSVKRQAEAMLANVAKVEMALQGFYSYLAESYAIEKGEGVNTDGKILRKPKPEAPADEPKTLEDEKKDAPTQ